MLVSYGYLWENILHPALHSRFSQRRHDRRWGEFSRANKIGDECVGESRTDREKKEAKIESPVIEDESVAFMSSWRQVWHSDCGVHNTRCTPAKLTKRWFWLMQSVDQLQGIAPILRFCKCRQPQQRTWLIVNAAALRESLPGKARNRSTVGGGGLYLE